MKECYVKEPFRAFTLSESSLTGGSVWLEAGKRLEVVLDGTDHAVLKIPTSGTEVMCSSLVFSLHCAYVAPSTISNKAEWHTEKKD